LNTIYLQTSNTKSLIFKIVDLLDRLKNKIKNQNKRIYTSDLIEILFSYPIITPMKLGSALNVHYTTASRYLTELTKDGFLKEKKIGKYHFFINYELMNILNK
jgi:Fic family protein